MDTLRIASAEYPVDFLSSWEAYTQKITGFFEAARQAGARLLVFPEYGALELASLLSDWLYSQMDGQILALQDFRDPMVRLHQALCDQTGLCALTASLPWRVGYSFEFRNRAWFLAPHAKPQWQEKIMLTRREREQWRLSAALTLHPLPTPWGPTGVLLGYDAEFPLLARHLAQQGAGVLLAPGCAGTAAAYYRLRLACRARALENQCFAVQSVTVGQAEWSPALAENHGQAGAFGPLGEGFPDDGQLGAAADPATNLLIADLDLARAAHGRAQGEATNHLDWNAQFRSIG